MVPEPVEGPGIVEKMFRSVVPRIAGQARASPINSKYELL